LVKTPGAEPIKLVASPYNYAGLMDTARDLYAQLNGLVKANILDEDAFSKPALVKPMEKLSDHLYAMRFGDPEVQQNLGEILEEVLTGHSERITISTVLSY
jgi:hypothetical protein